ncbi:MAG: hypothetical protein P8P74_03715 [Crocinitomicaceae bacterium]|nr:hypothetical protein [Crocinitomicaceae bacterium]
MIATLSTLTISTLLAVSHFSNSQEKVEGVNTITGAQTEQNIEIHNENGIQKTIVFDDNNSIIEVIVDSSEAIDKKSTASTGHEPMGELPLQNRQLISQGTEGSIVDQPIEVLSVDSLTARRFDFTDKTTLEDLEAFKTAAKAAGIEVDYRAKIRRSILKKINLQMSIKSDSERKICSSSSVYKAKTFRFQTGWMEDENGKAVRFLENDEIEPFEARY